MLWPETTLRDSQGVLTIGGLTVTSLVAEYGTPLYVFDETTLRSRAQRIRDAITTESPRSEFVFAAKALASPAILNVLHSEGAGIDVVSSGELLAAIRAGIEPRHVTFHGNNKSSAELDDAVTKEVGLIVLDHSGEIAQLQEIALAHDRVVDVLIRLNPGIDVHTHDKIATGVVDSKFGFPVWTSAAGEAVDAVLAASHLNLRGYHTHLGSQISDLDVPAIAIGKLMEFAAEVRDRTGFEPEILSPGGGMAIAYTGSDREVDPVAWIRSTTVAIRATCERFGLKEPMLVFEPGRYLVGPAAIALYTVGARKEIPGVRTYVSVDGGMADNIRPSLYGAVYTAELANREDRREPELVTIAGRYCESGDVLIEDILLPRLEAGDLLAIPGAGAYTLSMASNYNMVPRPAVVMVSSGSSRLTRKRETLDDLLEMEIL